MNFRLPGTVYLSSWKKTLQKKVEVEIGRIKLVERTCPRIYRTKFLAKNLQFILRISSTVGSST